MEHDFTVYKKEPGLVFIMSRRLLDFGYTSKSKLFKTLNGFTHGLGPYGVEAQMAIKYSRACTL